MKIEKDWIYENLRCIVIMTRMGHRCGYVGVDKTHPYYGRHYYDIESEEYEESVLSKINVHGGLTFADGDGKYPVESDLWWFGFDCAHYRDAKDLSVVEDERLKEIYLEYNHGTIRTLKYCIKECESMADQLNNENK